MNRYWNGHQWKDLPATDASDEETDEETVVTKPAPPPAPISAAPVEEPAPISAAPADALPPPAVAVDTITPLVVPVDTASSPAPFVAISVPTHAEYGDVFAAAAQEAPKSEG